MFFFLVGDQVLWPTMFALDVVYVVGGIRERLGVATIVTGWCEKVAPVT